MLGVLRQQQRLHACVDYCCQAAAENLAAPSFVITWLDDPAQGCVMYEVRAPTYVYGYLCWCAGVCALRAYAGVVPLFVPSTLLYPSSVCYHGTTHCPLCFCGTVQHKHNRLLLQCQLG
jgi:hypothetical protein